MAALPTNAIAQNTLTGAYLGPGVECPQFQTDDGEQISLRGAGAETLVVGASVQLTGQFLRASPCMQGRTFSITAITHLPQTHLP